MKGGYNGVRDREGDPCPVCRSEYDRYIAADDRMEFPDKSAYRTCVSVNNAAYASGGYVHFTGSHEYESTSNNATGRDSTMR